jgi:F0F1-type ATP synthase assembly protein I
MTFAGLGMLNVVCLLGGCGLGWLVDRWLGTFPIFLFVGLIAGVGIGARTTWREVKPYL